ncbi:trace amine-associated receptor 13c-like [Oryzias latipes]|uniref:trace amine-associated receptor 13c-like n=1 Tax=Oryzias latipes TaxID=8090 RepID=UPI000CE2738D|nr:trace amine-associated receptor 13c-like [Oryzias latipes]
MNKMHIKNWQIKIKLIIFIVTCYFMQLNVFYYNDVFLCLYRQLHTPTNILLLSLAVSDFLVGLLSMPVDILRKTSCWFLGDSLCSLFIYVSYIITSASVGVMVLISADRFVAICDPLHYPSRVTERRAKVCVCLCWLISALYNIILVKDELIQLGMHNSCYGECVIIVDNITGTIDTVLTFIVPVFVIVVLYMRVFVVAVSQARAMRSHVTAVTLQLSVAATTKKSELKAARTLGVLVIVFLLCFCPYYCYSIAGSVLFDRFSEFVYYLFFFNSTINPLIYTLFYPWFRKAVKLIITLQILEPGSCETNIL